MASKNGSAGGLKRKRKDQKKIGKLGRDFPQLISGEFDGRQWSLRHRKKGNRERKEG